MPRAGRVGFCSSGAAPFEDGCPAPRRTNVNASLGLPLAEFTAHVDDVPLQQF